MMTRADVAKWVPVEVLLVIFLSVPPLLGWEDLGLDLAIPPLFVGLIGNFAGNAFLFVVMVKDSAAVLCTMVVALLILGCWVVHTVEELEQ